MIEPARAPCHGAGVIVLKQTTGVEVQGIEVVGDVLAGVVLIGVISSALRLESVTVNVINIIIGLLLVASVVASSLLTWLTTKLRRVAPDSPPTRAPAAGGATPERQAS